MMNEPKSKLLNEEMEYDKQSLTVEHSHYRFNLAEEQKIIYSTVIRSIQGNNAVLFFIYTGGTGKTYLWKIIISFCDLKE